METIPFKRISSLLFGIAFICAIFMLTGRTFGFGKLINPVFYISGAGGLITSLLAARQEAYKGDFNLLFWIGSLVVFIGLLFKTMYLPYHTYILIGGMAITGLSYFISPFENEGKDEELLDR